MASSLPLSSCSPLLGGIEGVCVASNNVNDWGRRVCRLASPLTGSVSGSAPLGSNVLAAPRVNTAAASPDGTIGAAPQKKPIPANSSSGCWVVDALLVPALDVEGVEASPLCNVKAAN